MPLTPAELVAIAQQAARSAWASGMTVLEPSGSIFEIPFVAEPEVLTREELAALAAQARAVASGAAKLARAILTSGEAQDRAALLTPFEGLEAEAMERLFEAPCPAVHVRVDFLRGHDGLARAIELNATIPAMYGYADLATHRWITAAARSRDLGRSKTEQLVDAAGSRVEELRRALVAFYASRGGTSGRPSIAMVARPGDAQIGELRHMADHFRRMGHDAANLVPDDCDPDRWDILYRHVWAHRVRAESPFARALRDPSRYVLVNPVNGVLETKALFARLSECGEDPALARVAALDEAEIAAARSLPRTRRVSESMRARLLDERPLWVLKRSWDYGGKSVHLGAEMDAAAWRRAVEVAVADTRAGGFLAQERIVGPRAAGTRVTPRGAESALLYRDVSVFGGLGPFAPSGSVVRAAESPIVNILGGGGLAPVVPEDVMRELA